MVDGSKSGVVERWEMAPGTPLERFRIGGLGAVNGRYECGNGHGAPVYIGGVDASRPVVEKGIAVDRTICAPVEGVEVGSAALK